MQLRKRHSFVHFSLGLPQTAPFSPSHKAYQNEKGKSGIIIIIGVI
jgi:hypothetical protein